MGKHCSIMGADRPRYEIKFRADDEWISVGFAASVTELCGVNDARFRVLDREADREISLGTGPTPS